LGIQSQQFSDAVLWNTIKLITEGRATRLPHVVEIRFSFLNGSFFVFAGDANSDWVLNALNNTRAKVRTRDLLCSVVARVATEDEEARALEAFASKYGGRVVRDWYSNPAACVCLTPEGPPTHRGAVKGEGGATTTYQEWVAQNQDYYQGIAAAFDSASEEYDFTIGHNYINTWIRKRSIRELLKLAKPEDTLLEVGCGTGAEAIEVSRYVSRIIATDISDKMIAILNKKVEARGLSERIVPLHVRAANISKVLEGAVGGKVRLAYSFNGALNSEPELDHFVNGLSSILVPGGYFICSIRNSFCLSEALSHAVVLQFEKMAPRKKQPIMVSVGGMDIPAFYYPPAAFSSFFSTKFELKKLVGLPAFLPPAYLSDYYIKFRNVASMLEKFEWALGGHFPFNRLGDQSLFVFQKR
jgi:SAM-dependent methyltransferase